MQETGYPGEGRAEMPNSRQGDTPRLTLAGSHHHPWARVRMKKVTGNRRGAGRGPPLHQMFPGSEGSRRDTGFSRLPPRPPASVRPAGPSWGLAHRVHLSRSAGEQIDPRANGSRTSTDAVCISRCTRFLLYVQGRTSHGEGRARR